MANTYKNIVITPNRDADAANVPVIRFSGGNATTNTDIYLRTYTISNGTLSFEGSAGQLFSITNDLSGTIFSVNDISGIPSLEVNADGLIKLGEFGGNVAFGRSSANYKLDIAGAVNASAILVNGSPLNPAGGGAAYFTGNNGDVGNATGLGDIFRVVTKTLSANVTIYSGNNAIAAGPITIAPNVKLTIQNDSRVAIV